MAIDRYEMPGATAIFTQLRSTPPSEGSAATVASDPITSSQPENTSVRPIAHPPPLIYPAILVKTGVLGLSLPEATHPAAGNPRSFRPLPDQRLRSPVPRGSLSRSNRHLLQCERSRSAIEPTGTRLLLGPGIQLRSIENNESYYRLEFRGTH